MTLYAAYDDWILGVAGWLDVTAGEVYNRIPDFIRLSEIECDKKLALREATRFAKTTIDNDGILTLPDDFNKMKVVTLPIDGRVLKAITPDYYYQSFQMEQASKGGATANADGYPVYYTIIGNKLQFIPLGVDLDVNIAYYRKAEPLSAQVPNNIYSDYAPECLLSGAVMYGMRALFEEERLAFWAEKFEDDIITANRRSEQTELGSSPLVMRTPRRSRIRPGLL